MLDDLKSNDAILAEKKHQGIFADSAILGLHCWLLAGIVQGQALETCIDMGHWLAHPGIQKIGPKYVAYLQCLQTATVSNIVIHYRNNTDTN